MSAPATTSLCPERYFEAECTTTSIPRSIGRWKIGVAQELSMLVTIARCFASAAHADKSCRSNTTLVGECRHRVMVFDRIAAAISLIYHLVSDEQHIAS